MKGKDMANNKFGWMYKLEGKTVIYEEDYDTHKPYAVLFDENFKSIGRYDVMYFMKDGVKTMCPDLDKPRE